MVNGQKLKLTLKSWKNARIICICSTFVLNSMLYFRFLSHNKSNQLVVCTNKLYANTFRVNLLIYMLFRGKMNATHYLLLYFHHVIKKTG